VDVYPEEFLSEDLINEAVDSIRPLAVKNNLAVKIDAESMPKTHD